MLLRISSHPRIHRHLPRSRLHLAAASESDDLPLNSNDPWIAKVIATAFSFSRSPDSAAARLASLRDVMTSSLAFDAIRRIPNAASALQLFELTRSSSFQIDHSAAAYRFLVEILCGSGLHKDALKVFDEMTANGHRPDDAFLRFLVESFVAAGQLDAAMGLIVKAPLFECRVRSYTLNKLIGLLVERKRVLDVVCFLKEQLGSRFLAPDTCSFNIIIKGLCRLRDTHCAFDLLREMGGFRCFPDNITYNILIDGLCRADQVDRAHGILRGIHSHGPCLPNVVTFTTVVSGYCKIGRMEEAFRVFGEMVCFGIKPSRVTYNVLIDGYGKAGDMPSAVSIYERMIVCGCPPDVVTFTSLIDGYCRSGQVDDAMKLWHEISEKKLRPNVYTFAVVINALCKKNMLSEARFLLKELNGRKDILPRAFIYNPVIDGFCKAGDVNEANSVLTEMMDKRCSPDKFTYTILIIGHCMKGRMSDAIDLFGKMLATGCAPDNITVNSLISCLLKAGMPNEVKHIMLIASERDFRLDLSSLGRAPLSLKKDLNASVAAY